MKTSIKVAFLSSLTTAALVYVILEWRPLRTEGSRAPGVTWAEPGALPAEPASAPAAPAVAAGPLSADEENNIDIYRKYSAGVVNITSTVLAQASRFQVVPVEVGTGSGLILDGNGNIVTNDHVIGPSLRTGGGLEVTLADKTKYQAKIVGRDPGNDLAVIRIEAPKEKLLPIPLGKSANLLVGQKVLAIGNPFGWERTLTTGIISATGRSIEANERIIENVIQTDAAINPGNSGGPLLNSSGEVIGINAQIASPSNGSVGIGFAIPVDTVARIVNDLVNYGYVRRPWVGIGRVFPMEGYPPELARRYGIPSNQGFMVESISRGSPAAQAGLRPPSGQVIYGFRAYPVGGDILLSFQGKPINTIPELAAQIDHAKAGETITFTILRGDQKIEVPVVLRETPPEAQR
ncbi:MAG TPA: trypsin-like peptidase domain-containing protein [Terriglobia bacterium]|nr:trypsin-like peptidase domain-containing protein [Terriglobia bacterium]